MPFGDHIVTYTLTDDARSEYVMGKGAQSRPVTPVTVPTADAPWWWQEYLTDLWKRRNHLSSRLFDGHTGLQRAQERWESQKRLWDHEASLQASRTAPHQLWDADEGEKQKAL